MRNYTRLSALDRSFLDIEDRHTHMHVGATCVFEAGPLRRDDGGIDIDRVARTSSRAFTFCRAIASTSREFPSKVIPSGSTTTSSTSVITSAT